MHFLIGALVVAGAIWLAIEFPNFRKALMIMGVGVAFLCAIVVAALLTSSPS